MWLVAGLLAAIAVGTVSWLADRIEAVLGISACRALCGGEAVAKALTDDGITDAVRSHQGMPMHRRWARRMGFAPVAQRHLTNTEVASVTPPMVYRQVPVDSIPWVPSEPSQPAPAAPAIRRVS